MRSPISSDSLCLPSGIEVQKRFEFAEMVRVITRGARLSTKEIRKTVCAPIECLCTIIFTSL